MRTCCFKPSPLLSKPILWVLPAALLLVLACCGLPSAHASVAGGNGNTDLGVVGRVYPIAERSFLDAIMDRLRQAQASGELAKIEADAKKRWADYAAAPPGRHFPRAQQPRTRELDMTLSVGHDLADQNGTVFAAKGTKVNPLALMRLSKDIIMFDGTDAAQAAWAKQYIASSKKPVKPILTDGRVMQLMEGWKTQLWFDQGGYLAGRFHIECLPAVLRQRGELLELEEVVVHD